MSSFQLTNKSNISKYIYLDSVVILYYETDVYQFLKKTKHPNIKDGACLLVFVTKPDFRKILIKVTPV